MGDLWAADPRQHPHSAHARIDHEPDEERIDPARRGCGARRWLWGCLLVHVEQLLRCDSRASAGLIWYRPRPVESETRIEEERRRMWPPVSISAVARDYAGIECHSRDR
jgi:hypothetical protein